MKIFEKEIKREILGLPPKQRFCLTSLARQDGVFMMMLRMGWTVAMWCVLLVVQSTPSGVGRSL